MWLAQAQEKSGIHSEAIPQPAMAIGTDSIGHGWINPYQPPGTASAGSMRAAATLSGILPQRRIRRLVVFLPNPVLATNDSG